jgi:predicted O-methyltransferase YrrM
MSRRGFSRLAPREPGNICHLAGNLLPARKIMQAAEHHQRGLASFRDGNLTDATSLLARAIELEETCERWNDWAAVHLAARHPAEAEIGFRRALSIEPQNPQVILNLGVLLATEGRPEEALPLLERGAPSAAGDEKTALQSLVAQCRQSLASRVRPPGSDPVLPELRRVLTPHTTALNNLALRMITIESHLAALAHAPAPASSFRGAPKVQLRETDIVPKIAMADVFLPGVVVQLASPGPVASSVSLPELCLLIHLMLRARARTIFEIGTNVGRTALNFALNSSASARTYTLDLPLKLQRRYGYRAGSLFYRSSVAKKIKQLYGDSISFDFSPFFNSSDFIFIDGSHAYAHALSDSLNALKLLRRGRGIIAWHDYGWEAVAPALNKLFREEKRLASMRHIEGTSLVFAEVRS